GPDDVGRFDLRHEVAVDDLAQIVDLVGRDLHVGGIAVIRQVGGADQREVALIGNGEDDAAIGVLQDVGLRSVEEAAHANVAALDQPQPLARLQAEGRVEEAGDPGPSRIDEAAGAHAPALAAGPVLDRRVPQFPRPPRAGAAGAREDAGAALAGVEGVQHDQARIVDPAIGIAEALGEDRIERSAGGFATEIHDARTWTANT